jgi:hypothetical protein
MHTSINIEDIIVNKLEKQNRNREGTREVLLWDTHKTKDSRRKIIMYILIQAWAHKLSLRLLTDEKYEINEQKRVVWMYAQKLWI